MERAGWGTRAYRRSSHREGAARVVLSHGQWLRRASGVAFSGVGNNLTLQPRIEWIAETTASRRGSRGSRLGSPTVNPELWRRLWRAVDISVLTPMQASLWLRLCGGLGLWVLISIGNASPAHGEARCSSPVGELVSVQGTIEVADDLANEVAPVWTAAGLNQPLCVGALIHVGDRSRAEIALANQTKLRIDQNTEVRLTRITDQGKSLLSILRGAAYFFSRQPRLLEIDTPFVTAGIEGTEFLLQVEDGRSLLTVFEGKVAWSNDQGQMMVGSGEAAVAEMNTAPAPYLLVRPRDAVQWALYYTPILLPLLTMTEDDVSMPAPLRQAVEAARRGDVAMALGALDAVAGADRDPRYHLYRAAILLMVGRADEALPEIDEVIATNPRVGLAYALRSVIAVAQDDRKAAIESARRAVQLDPEKAATLIALSYAEQASGRIEAARDAVKRAVAAEPGNALAWARLSEVELMLGDRRRASKAADRAVETATDVARVWTARGFAALAAIEVDQAKQFFEQAIALDSADPQPRLGLGLAMVRRGDLRAGRRQIEIAVALDPGRSLLRSYLGKAYFEEKRDVLAGDQFGMAKELDPSDPTPWLYDAIRKQTENRPVEALRDLQTSIELNDNRAVYRSQTLLDHDRAARGASLARIYNDLGFQQAGLNEASAALALDPANSAAHRFLSDVYAAQPRLEIARASELLQAQLLQEVNINPIQPSLLENDFDIITRGGPARPGFNEYTALFDRNQVQLDATGVVGNNQTRGGEAIVSGLYDWLSVSAGQFASSSDGFRRNFDSNSQVTDIFAQAAVTPDFNVQAEFRRRTSSSGDLRLQFDPNDYSGSLKRDIDQDTARLGGRYSIGPSSDVLTSLIYTRRNARMKEPNVPLDEDVTLSSDQRNRQTALQGETQHIYRGDTFNLVSGFSAYNVKQKDRNTFSFTLPVTEPETPAAAAETPAADAEAVAGEEDTQGTAEVAQVVEPTVAAPVFETVTDESSDKYSIDQRSIYSYGNIRYPENFTWTIGISVAQFKELETNYWSVNPKFGLEWTPWSYARLRFAAFRTVKPTLVVSQTLEPTQVAGFNQFFDDINGTQATTVGTGVDVRLSQSVYVGADVVGRSLNIPVSNVDQWIDATEARYRSYLYWTPSLRWAVSTEVTFDHFSAGEAPFPDLVATVSLPLALTYFDPSGFFAGVAGTFVNQAVKGRDALGNNIEERENRFFLLNAQIGYRLPLRLGLISFQCNNLLNQHFNYYDESYRESGSQNPRVSPYLPERTFFATLTLQY